MTVKGRAPIYVRRGAFSAALVALVLGAPAPLASQQRDSLRSRTDSLRPAKPLSAAGVAARAQFKSPLSPTRAFIYSAVLPGFGQSRLDRGSSGALFASVELAGLVMLRRTHADLREARRFLTDTLPADFIVGQSGVTKSGSLVGRYTSDLVRTRRLHLEDWIAVVAFNHLFAGAEAFVSAQLWNIPVQLTASPTPSGPTVAATVRF